MAKHLNIKIYGQVQGVFFRVSAQEKAKDLGISGFTRNEKDGSVYIEVEGEKENLDKFVDWCKDGPEKASVEKIDLTKGPLKNFKNFERDFVD